MAKVIKRTWRAGPHRTKRVAWGYTRQVNGRQLRIYNADWSREQAQEALAQALLEVEQPAVDVASAITFGAVVEKYFQAKSRKKSLSNDKLYLGEMVRAFGADTPITDITSSKVSSWKSAKLAAVNPRTGVPYSPASINRPLAALRHLFRLAAEWEEVKSVPKIRFEREPQGRIRWLESDEEVRLLDACRRSRNPELYDIVVVALETGMRRGELLGLTWDRVDLSRGVIRLEITKSGKRREVPMRQAVYEVLAGRQGREGRVFKTRSIRSAFEYAVALARIDDFRFHDCRHHFASWFMMRNGSLQALKEILGYRDIKTTLIYAHLSPYHLRNEIARTERSARTPAQKSAHEVAPEVAALQPAR